MRPATVRDWFRAHLTGELAAPGEEQRFMRVGELELASFQRSAVRRGLKIARRYGGVLLADTMGLGKTRVGLAIAASLRRDARALGANRPRAPGASGVLCCAPARLKAQWETAAAAAKLSDFRVISHARLSRNGADELIEKLAPAVVLVDEAHRFRNPKAQRSRRLAALGARAPLILMSATPICNSIWDLYHLLRLFLAEHDLREATGEHLAQAFRLAEAGEFDLVALIERLVIRRVDAPNAAGFGRRPGLEFKTLIYQTSADEAWLWQRLEGELRALTLELFRADWPRQLWVEYMLKRRESGADALYSSLAEMVDFHRRWLDAKHAGMELSRAGFRRLFAGAASDTLALRGDNGLGSRQEIFCFLYEPNGSAVALDQAKVVADYKRLRALLARVAQVLREGGAKPARLLKELQEHDEKYLIFTGFQHTARALFGYLSRRLGSTAQVGVVSGRGAQATGLGRIAGDELVWRFAPRSNARPTLAAHQQIRVLISTDCLAEGVNLQDCRRVILYDLPYSPLVVEQRIGRLLRPGAAHNSAIIYQLRPARWADTLGLERRLNQKIRGAASAGAGFVAAHNFGTTPHSGGDKTSNPLAALTRLDALSAALSREQKLTDEALKVGFWRAEIPRGPARLWLRVQTQEAGGERRHSWCQASCQSGVLTRLSELIDELIADADLLEELRRVEPAEIDPELLERAIKSVEARQELLRAARLAPYPLRLDAPQRALWSRLRDAIEARQIEINADELEALRYQLLRAHPRGLERAFEALAASQLPPNRLLERTRRFLKDAPRWHPEVSLKIIGGLWLEPALNKAAR